MRTGYYVVRVWTHTDRKQLWKVVSRAIKSRDDAEDWREFMEDTEPHPKYKYFVVEALPFS